MSREHPDTDEASAKPTRRPAEQLLGRLAVAFVTCAAFVGIVMEVASSVTRIADPADPGVCAAIWPPATPCMPHAHLVVSSIAVLVLGAAWYAADRALRRGIGPAGGAVIIFAVTLVSAAAYCAARVPQPFVVAWSLLFG